MLVDLKRALEILHNGDVVAIPTDTVYGLAALPDNEKAVKKLFLVKKRAHNKPMNILVPNTDAIKPFVSSFPPQFQELTQKFWPGALTLVIPIKTETLATQIRAELPTAGFRVPNHPETLQLLKQSGPLVTTSANLSEQTPALTPQDVEKIFGDNIPILKGQTPTQGLASTILAYKNNAWTLLRQGNITPDLGNRG